MFKPKNILIIRFSALGDLVLSTPIFRELKRYFPDTEITLLTASGTGSVLKNNPHIDHFIWHKRNETYSELKKLTKRLHKESHQIMDSISMVQPISKWAQTILTAENISEVVRKAFKVAETEKPGLTVIELPEDIAEEEVNEKPIKPVLTRRPAADNRAIEEALDLIINSRNPIILAGNYCCSKVENFPTL